MMEMVWQRAAQMLALVRPYLRVLLLPAGAYTLYRLIPALIPGPQHQSKLVVRNRTVLITGASSGLGRELAIKFYREGAKLILTARSIDKLKELCEELKQMQDVENENEPVYEYLDICDANGFNEIVSLAKQQPIDVLVNNAGLSMRGACKDTSMHVYRQLMDVNYFGHIALTKALLDYIPDDGAILVTSSVQGRIAVPYRSAYSASKHAAQAFFDSLRCEDRPQLQILVVSAGYMNTGFGRHALNVRGEPMNVDDANQAKGLDPTYAAERIFSALVNRKTELLLAPLLHRLGIFLRWLWPNLFFYLNYRRSLKEAAIHHAKQE